MHEALAHRHDVPVGDGALLGDGMRLIVLAHGLQRRNDVLAAGIGFAERGHVRILSRGRTSRRAYARVAASLFILNRGLICSNRPS